MPFQFIGHGITLGFVVNIFVIAPRLATVKSDGYELGLIGIHDTKEGIKKPADGFDVGTGIGQRSALHI